MIRKILILCALLTVGILLTATVAPAQDGQGDSQTATPSPTPQPLVEPVTVEASDGLVLVGDYYPLSVNMQHTGVLLIHMLNSNRRAYDPLIPYLLDAGYSVLNVDMRGHGDTGGARDWPLAEQDVQVWLDWMGEQPGLYPGVAIIGGSIGANLALMGCNASEQCVTAVALSPGQDYTGVMPENALFAAGDAWSAYLIGSHDDTYSAQSIEWFFANAPGEVSARLYPGRAHGTNLFGNELESVSHTIVSWLDEHTRAGQ